MQSTVPPFKAGLVPAEYVKALPTAAATTPALTEAVPASPAPSYPAALLSSPAQPASSGLGDSILGRTGLGFGSFAGSASSPSGGYGGKLNATSATAHGHGQVHGASAAEEFGALFASHEEWFRAAAQKRQEVSTHTCHAQGQIARLLRSVC